MAALCDLLGEATEFADYPRCTNGARAAAMAALVNFTHASDANRQLLVALKGLPPVVDAAANSPVQAHTHKDQSLTASLLSFSFFLL
jgi:hypothetical protein